MIEINRLNRFQSDWATANSQNNAYVYHHIAKSLSAKRFLLRLHSSAQNLSQALIFLRRFIQIEQDAQTRSDTENISIRLKYKYLLSVFVIIMQFQ